MKKNEHQSKEQDFDDSDSHEAWLHKCLMKYSPFFRIIQLNQLRICNFPINVALHAIQQFKIG